MFEHRRFGLEQAVIDYIKTMTRRAVSERLLRDAEVYSGGDIKRRDEYLIAHAPYKVGDVVAIKQSYEAAGYEPGRSIPVKEHGGLQVRADSLAGWTNKMFVRADLMPHRICITDVKVEYLQDISDEDCRKEGIIHVTWRQYMKQDPFDFGPQEYEDHDVWTLPIFEESLVDPWALQEEEEYCAESPDVAYAVLIFKLMGRKVWDKNPLVFAYEFEYLKQTTNKTD